MSLPRCVLGGVAVAWFASTALAQTPGAPAVAETPSSADAPITVATAEQPAPPQRPRLGEGVAAIVNDEIISSYDLRQRMRLLVATSGVQPNADSLPQIEREALRSLVDEHLEMQEVRSVEQKQKDLKLEPTDKELEDAETDMARQSGLTRTQLLTTLKTDEVDPATLRDQLRAHLSWERYIAARFRDNVEIGDNQVRAAFDRASAEAAQPQYLLGEIFIDAAQAGGRDQAMTGARQLIEQIQQGAPFSAVAHQFSGLPTAANGGDAGWVTGAQVPPEVEAVLEQMRPGQLSEPVAASDGVYIVQLRDKRAGAQATVVDLKQAAIRLAPSASAAEISAAEAKLEALRARIHGCETLESQAAKIPNVVAGDLGETEVKDLRPSFQEAAGKLKIGEVSAPIRTDAGLHLIAVCERHASGARAITRASIEDRLRGEQYDMFARRFLRDLRNSATIETR
jgi:peptidyl-prolyl cis-trans isomerase SurA